MIIITVKNAEDADEVVDTIFADGSGVERALGSGKNYQRNSLVGDAVIILGHIVASLAAAKTVIELLNLVPGENEMEIIVVLTDEKSGKSYTVKGNDPEQVRMALEKLTK